MGVYPLLQVLATLLLSSQFLVAFGRPQDPSPAVAATEAAPAAAPSSSSANTPIPIISQTEIFGPDGSFNFRQVYYYLINN